jgi:predicted alpha/beta superfamily hydrolase
MTPQQLNQLLMRTILLSAFLLFFSAALFSQAMSSIPLAKSDTLSSSIIAGEIILKISLPYPFNPSQNAYPTMYYLDAFGFSGGINELVKSKMWSNAIDNIIMVGISYNTNPFQYGKVRERDYLPALTESDEEHKADEFLKFIKSELIPYMEENYGADPEDRGLLGFSYGGFFTTYTLKEAPGLFTKLAIISPSLQYGDAFLLEDPKFIANIQSASNLKIFLSYGRLEGQAFMDYGEQFQSLCETNPNINIDKVIFEGEDHGSVWNTASTRAILKLYANEYDALLQESRAYYREQDFEKSLETYQLVFAKFPDKVQAGDHYDLACLYALTADPDHAFEHLSKLKGSSRDWVSKMKEDEDLKALRADARWAETLLELKR